MDTLFVVFYNAQISIIRAKETTHPPWLHTSVALQIVPSESPRQATGPAPLLRHLNHHSLSSVIATVRATAAATTTIIVIIISTKAINPFQGFNAGHR